MNKKGLFKIENGNGFKVLASKKSKETSSQKMKKIEKYSKLFLAFGVIYIVLGVGLLSAVIFSLGAFMVLLGLFSALRFEQLRELSIIQQKLNQIVRDYGKKRK